MVYSALVEAIALSFYESLNKSLNAKPSRFRLDLATRIESERLSEM